MPTATKTRERTSASSRPNSTTSRPGSVLAMLKTEHKEVKGLFDQFEKETQQSPSAGKATADKICSELIRHAEMEEKIIYPELKSQDEEIFYESTEEHHVVEMLITEIRAMRPDPSWRAKVTVLGENVRHHIQEEEKEGFKQLRKLGASRLNEMGKRWQETKAAWKPMSASRSA